MDFHEKRLYKNKNLWSQLRNCYALEFPNFQRLCLTTEDRAQNITQRPIEHFKEVLKIAKTAYSDKRNLHNHLYAPTYENNKL